jgi:transposase
VDQLDLSCLEQQYSGKGKRAYSPPLLLSLLFYGYSTGVFSSRQIETATYDSVAFRYLAGNQHPDHDTICAFRRRFLDELKALFVQILQIAREMGFAKLGTVAIDGTKVKANASKHKAVSWKRAKRMEKRLRREIAELMRTAEQADSSEQDSEMDIPEEIRMRKDRLARLEQAKRAIEEQARLLQEQKDSVRGNNCAAAGKGGKSKPRPRDKDQHNFTDSDSRIMLDKKNGFQQAYNAQAAVDAEDMLIVGTSLSNNGADAQQLEPTLDSVSELNDDTPGSIVADAGYFSEDNVNLCESRNIDSYIALGRQKHNKTLRERLRGRRRPRGLSPVKRTMWYRLNSELGKELYRVRKSTVEPVLGIIKEVMGFRQFMLRGLAKTRGEWDLVCIAYDLRRLHRLAMT